jgi:hypothetical protein
VDISADYARAQKLKQTITFSFQPMMTICDDVHPSASITTK